MKKLGLIPKLIIAIVLGILIGAYGGEIPVRLLATFNSIFGNFLGFIIPLIILGFVIAGIADLGEGAGKLLGVTTALAYGSTLIAGFVTYVVAKVVFPAIIKTAGTLENAVNPEEKLLSPFFQIDMPPVMGVMTALILAFILGLGISVIRTEKVGDTLYKMAFEFQKIVEKVISAIIIPLLPIHVGGIFANMTHAGEVTRVLSVFWKVFLIVIAIHFTIMLFQFGVACAYGRKNLFSTIKKQVPGYLTAIGTQSSAATIPVNVECSEKMGVSKGIRDFVVPLCATIHLSGSTITLTSCAIAVMMLNNIPYTPAQMTGFIMMLGVTMVAAPGVPGGAVMAALGVLQSMLGFTEAQLGLMIALYITQDSFGTACNVSGDNAIAIIVDKFYEKQNA